MEKSSLTVGPWGGNSGSNWDDGRYTGVREIKLVYNLCIDSILVVYDKQGHPFKATKRGGAGGNNVAVIELEYPDEFLINVSGHYGPLITWQGGNPCIRSLIFKSNRRTFGPYGVEEGKRFTYSSYPIHEIVGFHGRSDLYLDSIGLHLFPARRSWSLNESESNTPQHSTSLLWKLWPFSVFRTDKLRPSKKQDEMGMPPKSLVVGPWGGNGGTAWDDGAFNGVREISLVYGLCIDSIVVVYDMDGQPFKAPNHGGGGGNKTAKIKLQYPNEFLVHVSGHYGPINARGGGDPYIRSLTFQSNCKTFGPYGVEEGRPFAFSTNGRQVLGLRGRSGGIWMLLGFICLVLCKATDGLKIIYRVLPQQWNNVLQNSYASATFSVFYTTVSLYNKSMMVARCYLP